MRDTLQLIRKNDNDALFRCNCFVKTRTMSCSVLQLLVLEMSYCLDSRGQYRLFRKTVNLYTSIAANNVIRMRQCETFSLPRARSTVGRLGFSSPPEKPRWVMV